MQLSEEVPGADAAAWLDLSIRLQQADQLRPGVGVRLSGGRGGGGVRVRGWGGEGGGSE